jgi:hypothetical protein
MTKWEYQVELCDPPELVDKLTEPGEYGWEVVSIVVAVYSAIDGPGRIDGLQEKAYQVTAKRQLA